MKYQRGTSFSHAKHTLGTLEREATEHLLYLNSCLGLDSCLAPVPGPSPGPQAQAQPWLTFTQGGKAVAASRAPQDVKGWVGPTFPAHG